MLRLPDAAFGELMKGVIRYAIDGAIIETENDDVFSCWEILQADVDEKADRYAQMHRENRLREQYRLHKQAKEQAGREPLKWEDFKLANEQKGEART
jgi:hypothetical protein